MLLSKICWSIVPETVLYFQNIRWAQNFSSRQMLFYQHCWAIKRVNAFVFCSPKVTTHTYKQTQEIITRSLIHSYSEWKAWKQVSDKKLWKMGHFLVDLADSRALLAHQYTTCFFQALFPVFVGCGSCPFMTNPLWRESSVQFSFSLFSKFLVSKVFDLWEVTICVLSVLLLLVSHTTLYTTVLSNGSKQALMQSC